MMGTGVASGENRARMAAEAAISSPLLEDVDMSGARGVLVNITAGLDMSIGEFEEVGDAIKISLLKAQPLWSVRLLILNCVTKCA